MSDTLLSRINYLCNRWRNSYKCNVTSFGTDELALLGRIEAKRMDNEDELDQLIGHYAKGDQMKTLSLETAKLLATMHTCLLYDTPLNT